jgi:hypothetical protein
VKALAAPFAYVDLGTNALHINERHAGYNPSFPTLCGLSNGNYPLSTPEPVYPLCKRCQRIMKARQR